MTLRRGVFWFNVSANTTLTVLNVTMALVAAGLGRPFGISVLAAVVTGTLAYVAVVVDDLVTARLAVFTAQQHAAEAATAVNVAMAEKIRIATIEFQALDDQRQEDRPRRH